MKRWRFQSDVDETLLAEHRSLPPLLARLLANRGVTTAKDVERFLRSSYDEHLHDPFLFRNMRKAVDRVSAAMAKNERIALYGDYDVDGVSALAILFVTFRALGYSNVSVTIPDRYREGYGLNMEAMKKMIDAGTRVLVTCDCGTSNVNEIAAANQAGLDVIVVDHHKAPPVLPDTYAFLNPALPDEPYPFSKLCSGGIAFKFATAILKTLHYGAERRETPLPTGWEKWLLDLAALATVADMMPLIDENRVLVKHGLRVLRKTRRCGIQELCRVMGTPQDQITASTIGFQIAPRLNAAGRLKHANVAFALLTTEDADEARSLAAELHETNQERRRLTETIFKEAIDQVENKETGKLIAAYGVGWSSGVIGLVAGKLKEVFHRPAVAIGEENGVIVGSGRSVPGFDITQALVDASPYLEKFGGHPMACGFTIKSPDDVQGFLDSLSAAAERALGQSDLTPEILIDQELPLADVTWELTDILNQLEPFGIAVTEPIFVTQNLRVQSPERVGRDGKHLRLRFHDAEGLPGKSIGFGFGDWADRLSPGDRIDLAYRVGIHEWNGNRSVQMTIVDLHPSA